MPDLRDRLLDASAELLARLHLAGFFWGDCSLSNTLFRRDAGALSAYLVDAETGELHSRLSDGQRLHDLEIAQENLAGELLDVAAELGASARDRPGRGGRGGAPRYEGLWTELTREEVFGTDERYHLDERLHRLNELGFDVEEIELVSSGDGYRLRLDPHVVEPGHHRRRLFMPHGPERTGEPGAAAAQRPGALSSAPRGAGGALAARVGGRLQMAERGVRADHRLDIPPDLWSRLEPAEVFHQILEYRWYLSEAAGKDVGLRVAVASYVDDVLRQAPDERNVLSRGSRRSRS